MRTSRTAAAEDTAVPPVRELTAGQQSLWLQHTLAPQGAAYNDGGAALITPPPPAGPLRQAVRATVQRHELLRSVFAESNGRPVRVVRDAALVPLEVRDSADATEAELGAQVRQIMTDPYRLTRQPPFRVVLLRRARDAVLVMTAHHIATDATSQRLIWRDLLAAYEATATGAEPAWPALTATFDDYVTRERDTLGSPRGAELERYWREACADGTAAELPTDLPRPPQRAFSGGTVLRRLPGELEPRLRAAASRLGVTPFAFLLGSFFCLLYRCTGQPDLMIGCPASTRRTRAMRDVVGLFVNPIALRARFTPRTTLAQAVTEASSQLRGGMARLDYPFTYLAARPDREPWFRITFTMVSSDRVTAGGDRAPVSLSGWPPDLAPADEPVSRAGHLMTFLETPRLEGQFDLSVEMTRTANAMTAVFRYDTDLFLPSTVEGLAGRFERMVAAACADPDTLVDRVPLLSDDERRRVLAMSGQASQASQGSGEQP